jgi:hypothetical protein
MTRFRILLSVAGLLAAFPGAAQTAEVFVFTGVANVPGWETRYEIANGRGEPGTVVLFNDSRLPGPCPPEGCGEREITLSANATATSDPFGNGVTTVFALIESAPMSIRARTFPTDESIELSFDVPSIRLSTLQQENPTQLVFPIRQDDGGRSNLALASIHGAPPAPASGEPLGLRIEAFESDGTLRGTLDVGVPDGGTVYIVRLLESFGLTEFEGQVRVTRLYGGPSLMWGVMYQINADGQTSSTPGLIP